MLRFIVRRLLLGMLVLIGVSVITFALARLVPADPAARWAGPRATAAQVAAAREELGLDKPLWDQYVRYMRGLLSGNWGVSIRTKQPVLADLKTYLPASIELVVASMLLAVAVGLPLGIISAIHKDSLIDHVSRVFSVGAVALPTFFFGMTLQLIFYRWLGWLPIGNRLDMTIGLLNPVREVTGLLVVDSLIAGNWEALWDALRHLVLPTITLSAYSIGLVARMMRSSLLEILSEDYIRMARAYGLPSRLVIYRYALKNALGPTVTVLALSAGYALVNTFLIEAIFAWPGLGSYTALAVVTLDYVAIMGVTLLIACVYVVLNLAADIVSALDPRVRV